MPDLPENERTYLDLAMRDYLFMREAMNKNLALNFQLILGALVVAGGLGAAVGLKVIPLKAEQQGILLLLDGAFGLLVFIAALGQLNAFQILELDVCDSAKEIRKITGAGRRHLLSFQAKVVAFNRNALRLDERGRAWLVSYGTALVVAIFALILLAGIVLLGAWLTVTLSMTWLAGLLMLLDAVLVTLTAVWLAFTYRNLGRWGKLFLPPKRKSATTRVSHR